jgi:hypothetical protein|tara:strand:+ start:1890 stop:2072 length:183 start_codon:yes stop_codon:yes gene_type:complete
MTDNEIENIQTLDIKVTAESIDAHVLCLRENGYKVEKSWTSWTKYTLAFLLGGYIIQVVL